MAITTVKTFEEYIGWTESLYRDSKLILFRGQPVQGNLLPSIARKTPTYDSASLERTLLDQFKLMGASMLTSVGSNLLELMVVAQHYGLKTRLLDWTSNPLAALYFACADVKEGNTYIYALESDDLLATDAYSKDPFSQPKTRVFQPPLNNPRILAQHGWFTLHRYSEKSRRFVSLENNKDTQSILSELHIPEDSRSGLLASLAGHGVASHTLFPDLAGLSQYLNRKYSVD